MPSPQRGSEGSPPTLSPASCAFFSRIVLSSKRSAFGNRSVFAEGPRIASIVDLRTRGNWIREDPEQVRRDRSLAFSAQSLRGHASYEAEGFPRHYPSTIALSLHKTVGLGSAVMSGLSLRVASEQGK